MSRKKRNAKSHTNATINSASKREALYRKLLAAGLACGVLAFPLLGTVSGQENATYQVGSVKAWNNLDGNRVNGNTVHILNDISGSMGSLGFSPSASFTLTADSPKTLDFQRGSEAITMNAKLASSHLLTIHGGNVTIKNACADDYFDYKGGAIYTYGSLILDNTSFTFSDCHAGDTFHIIVRTYDGGALYSTGSLSLSGSNVFNNNSVTGERCDSFGGAISAANNVTLSGTEIFSGNSAKGSSAKGGAVHAGKSLDITGNTQFANNSVYGVHTTGSVDDARGGAVYSYKAMTLNGTADFSNNYAEGGSSGAWGGAIAVEESSAQLDGSYRFTGNSIRTINTAGANSALGGAIFTKTGLTLNGTGYFSGNSVKNTSDAYGGALYSGGAISLSGNQTFTGNSVTASHSSALVQNQYALGGAIYAASSLQISGTSVFTNNSADSYHTAWGGAIYSDGNDVTFSGNGSNAYFDNNAVNGSPNDIYIRFGRSVNIRDAGNYYFGSGITTTTWVSRHGQLNISSGANVTLGAGSQNSLAGGISLSGATLQVELTEGNLLSGENSYANAQTATAVSGALSANSSSRVLFDVGLLGVGTYLVTNSNWSNAVSTMSAVSEYYKSFDSTIESTSSRTTVSLANIQQWPVFRYDINGNLSAGEDSVAAALNKNGNLANGDRLVLSDSTSETGTCQIGNKVNLTITSDTAGTLRTLDATGNTNHSLLNYAAEGTVNDLTLSDLVFTQGDLDQGVISTAGSLTVNANNVTFAENRFGITGQGKNTKISMTGQAAFYSNTVGDLVATTLQLGDGTNETNLDFETGVAATTVNVNNATVFFGSGSVNTTQTLNLNGNANVFCMVNADNIVEDYSATFKSGATQLSSPQVAVSGTNNAVTFYVAGTYETANHEILAAVGDFSTAADLISAQLSTDASGIAYVKWIGENASGEKGVWLGYENFTTTSAVYRYQNGERIDFGDSLPEACTGETPLDSNDTFVLTDNVHVSGYDGVLEINDYDLSLLSNVNDVVRTIETPEDGSVLSFTGGNTITIDDIAFSGGQTIFQSNGTGTSPTAGQLTLNLNNASFLNATTAISASDLTMTGNAVFTDNGVAINASTISLDGAFAFKSTTSDIAGASAVTLASGGNYSFESGLQSDLLTVCLNGYNATTSKQPGTTLSVLGNLVTGNTGPQTTKFLLTDVSSEYYRGTTSDWSGYTGTVTAQIDPTLNAGGYVFVYAVDDEGVLLRYDNGMSLVYRTISPDDDTVVGGGNTLSEAVRGVSGSALSNDNVLTFYGDTQETETTHIGHHSLTFQSDSVGTTRLVNGPELTSVISADGGNVLTFSDVQISGANVGISALAGDGKTGIITVLGTASFRNNTADVVAQDTLTFGDGSTATSIALDGGLATDNLNVNSAAVRLGSNSISQVDDTMTLANNASVTVSAVFDPNTRTLGYSQLACAGATYSNDGTGTWSVTSPDADQIKTAAHANMVLSNDQSLLDELHTAFNDQYHSLLYDIYIGKTDKAYGIYAEKTDPGRLAQQIGGNAPGDLVLYGDDFLDVQTVEEALNNAQSLSRESFAAAGVAQVFRLSHINRMLTGQIVSEEPSVDGTENSSLRSEHIIRGNLPDEAVESAGCKRLFHANGYGSTGNVAGRRGFAGSDFRYGGFTTDVTWSTDSASIGLFYGYGQTRFSAWTSDLKSDDHTFGGMSKWNSLYGGGYTVVNGLFSLCGYRDGNYLQEPLDEYDAFLGGTAIERGWKFSSGTASWNPYWALQYIGYNGESLQQGNMTVGDQAFDSFRSRVGIRRTATPRFLTGRAAVRLGADWLHEFADTQGCFIANVQNAYAPIYSADTGRDWLEATTGLTYSLSERMELAGEYFVLTNRHVTQQAASGSLTVRY